MFESSLQLQITSLTYPKALWNTAKYGLLCLVAAAVGLAVSLLPLSTVLGLTAAVIVVIAAVATPYAALFVLLVCAPLRALIDVRAPGLLPIDLGQLGLALMAGTWLLHVTATRVLSFSRFSSPAVLAVGGFVAAGALSGFTAANLGVWLSDWLKWVFVFLLVLWVLSVQKWEWIIAGLALAGIANAIVGIWIYFGGSGAEHFLIDGVHFRAFGTFEQPNPFGGFMGMLSPLFGAAMVGYLRIVWSQRRGQMPQLRVALLQAVFYAVAFVLTALALVFSWSRGAWLAFGIASVVTLLSIPRRAWVRAQMFLVIAFIVAAAVMSGRLPASVVDRVGSAFSDLVFRRQRG